MSFLNPWAIAIAAGLTVPPLVALYFLKLRRQARLVPTTLLWKKAIEDLHVNAPFQRLRASLLLFLQLLALALAALALGQPMFQTAERHDETLILLVDQSASMNVMESEGRTRLDRAKEQAKRCIDNLGRNGRAMVIAFCDRAIVVAPFDNDRAALKRHIDSIEQTDSSTRLSEAISLAEAYAQNIIIGGTESGTDIPPERMESPATVFLFTDGRVEDAGDVTLQQFDLSKLRVTNVAERQDNVGIMSMNARRNYESPQILEVAASVKNFGPKSVTVDADLYIDGQNVDVKSLQLESARTVDGSVGVGESTADEGMDRSVAVVAFDDLEYEGGGVVEVQLRVDDGLAVDDRAWAVVDPPRRASVLLVDDGNEMLARALRVLNIRFAEMTPDEYELAPEETLADGDRSRFDLVVMDRHSTARLPRGNYFFWGGIPIIEGVQAEGKVTDEYILNWDETHPMLRHVAVDSLEVGEWTRLELPPETLNLIEGPSTPVLSYFTREGSQFLISAFSLIAEDETGRPVYNTYWGATTDFVVFMYNAVSQLSGALVATADRSLRPGQPASLPVPPRTDEVRILRPDRTIDPIPAGSYGMVYYARTRSAGIYQMEPGLPGADQFAVNLFNEIESDISPAPSVTIGAGRLSASASEVVVNRPAWRYLLLGLLLLILLEWVVYNRRIFV